MAIEASPQSRLASRAADQLVASWSEYWPFAAEDGGPDPVESRRRARLHLSLASEIFNSYLDEEGWDDFRGLVASVALATFGDGYLLLSMGWPHGIAGGALPEPFSLADSIVGGNLQDWCREHGHPFDLALPEAGCWKTPLSAAEASEYDALARKGLALDYEAQRRRETPDSDGYATATLTEATRLRFWMAEYLRAYAAFPVDGDFSNARAGMSEMQIAREIAALRQSPASRREGGLPAVAVLAAGFTLQLVRGTYLMASATPGTARADIQLLPPDRIDLVLAKFNVNEWLAREPR